MSKYSFRSLWLLIFASYIAALFSFPVVAATSDPSIRGGVIRLLLPAYPETLRTIGPNVEKNSLYAELRAVQLPLLQVKAAPDEGSCHLSPALATQWYATPTTISFHINEQALWSDKVPVTAKDVVFTLDFIMSGRAGASVAAGELNRQIKSVNYEGLQLTIESTEEADSSLLCLLGDIRPLAAHAYQNRSGWPGAFDWFIAPTTGPYFISNIKHGDSVTFQRTPNWWGDNLPGNDDRYNVGKVIYSTHRDPLRAFISGELDVLPFIQDSRSNDYFQKFARSRKANISKTSTLSGSSGLIINGQRQALSQLQTRQYLISLLNNSREFVFESQYTKPEVLNIIYTDGDLKPQIEEWTASLREHGISLQSNYFELSDFLKRLSLGQFDMALLSFQSELSPAGVFSLFKQDTGAIYIPNPGLPPSFLSPETEDNNAALRLAKEMESRSLLIPMAKHQESARVIYWDWVKPTHNDPELTYKDPLADGRVRIDKKARADILAQPFRRHNKATEIKNQAEQPKQNTQEANQ